MLKDKAEEKKATKKSRHLLACEGVAEFLGVSSSMVRKIAAAGDITPIQLSPRCVRYDIRDVRRFVETRRASEARAPIPVVGCDGGGWRRIEIRRANRSRVALTLDVEVIESLWDMGVITPSATDPNLYDSDHLSIHLRRDRGPARFQIYLHPMRQGRRRTLVWWILGVAGKKGSAPLHRNGDFSDWRAENLRGPLDTKKRAKFRIGFAALISPTNGTGEKPEPEPAKEEKTENTPDHAPSPEAVAVPVLKDKEKTMTDPLRFCSDSVSHPFIANSPKEFREIEETRSSHLTWGGVWEMVAKELFSKYIQDSGVCWAIRDDEGILHLREIGEHVGGCASVIADEMLYKAREYCERETIDPNAPLA